MVSSPCLAPIGAKLTPYYNSRSANGRMELVIVSQPEEQHRARYLTEGSRGAIKDISGFGHPVVRLNGYMARQPIKLECYIGHDKHNGLPHLFYQASKISGKNSTQCTACKVEGTSVIVMNLLPEHGMQATIDCVGILKERNVDVEQKLLNLNSSHHRATVSMTEQTNGLATPTTPGNTTTPACATSNFQPTAFGNISQQQHQLQQPQTNQQQATTPLGPSPAQFQMAQQVQPLGQQQQQQQHHHHHNHNHHIQHSQFLNESNASSIRHFQAMDENSIGQMSRADSFEDSNDLSSRHSIHTIASHHHLNDESSQMSIRAPSCISSSVTNQLVADNTNSSCHAHSSTNNSNLVNGTQTNGQQVTNDSPSSALLAQTAVAHTNLASLNSRKRSVRCRLVFRVKIPETGEVLQTVSTPIICTQPLGTPEICKKSLNKAPIQASSQQLELFIIGKNFLKDSKVVFRSKKGDWCKTIEPEKEFLNTSHLVCKVPDYEGPEILSGNPEMVEVELLVRSGGKLSEPHNFVFIGQQPQPLSQPMAQQTQRLDVACLPAPEQVRIKFDPMQPTSQQQQQQQQPQQQSSPVTQQQQLSSPQIQLHDTTQHAQIQSQPMLTPSQQPQQHQQYQADTRTSPFEQQQEQQQHQQQIHQQQQQQSQALTTLQGQQIQQQVVIQQAPAQQQTQMVSQIDLNDDTTVIYADTIQTQPNGVVHGVITQNGTIISNIGQSLEQMTGGNMNATQAIQIMKQQQQQVQQLHQQQQQQQFQPTKQTSPFDSIHQTVQEQQQHHHHQQQQIQHLSLQHQQQQQTQSQPQMQTNIQPQRTILTSSDLCNDETTVIYADNLLGPQTTSSGNGLIQNVIQAGSLMGSIDIMNEDACMSISNNNQNISYYTTGPILG